MWGTSFYQGIIRLAVLLPLDCTIALWKWLAPPIWESSSLAWCQLCNCREEDLLDLAPFLAENSRLGKFMWDAYNLNLIPRPFLVPVFDHLQYAKTKTVFAYCKWSKTWAGEGLGTRLYNLTLIFLDGSLSLATANRSYTCIHYTCRACLPWSLSSLSGCQIILTKEMDGIELVLPKATRNFYVDGHVPQPHWVMYQTP